MKAIFLSDFWICSSNGRSWSVSSSSRIFLRALSEGSVGYLVSAYFCFEPGELILLAKSTLSFASCKYISLSLLRTCIKNLTLSSIDSILIFGLSPRWTRSYSNIFISFSSLSSWSSSNLLSYFSKRLRSYRLLSSAYSTSTFLRVSASSSYIRKRYEIKNRINAILTSLTLVPRFPDSISFYMVSLLWESSMFSSWCY